MSGKTDSQTVNLKVRRLSSRQGAASNRRAEPPTRAQRSAKIPPLQLDFANVLLHPRSSSTTSNSSPPSHPSHSAIHRSHPPKNSQSVCDLNTLQAFSSRRLVIPPRMIILLPSPDLVTRLYFSNHARHAGHAGLLRPLRLLSSTSACAGTPAHGPAARVDAIYLALQKHTTIRPS